MAAVVVVGLGNIGSHLVQYLVRMTGIFRLILVDSDRYEGKNMRNQLILLSDLGKHKAAAQSTRLQTLLSGQSPGIEAVCEDIANVPWGKLQCDVMLSCCDNRRARQYAAETAWRLGIPYLDSGVRRAGMLARVDIYVPGNEDSPCYECTWTDEDYERLEIHYPCTVQNDRELSATDSPSYLGSLAASIQAVECAKILGGNFENAGSSIVISANSYRCYRSRIIRNRSCRFDHCSYDRETLKALPVHLSVQQILDGRIKENSL